MIRNIVFDMGGVLIYFDYERILDCWGVVPEDRALIRTEVFKTVEWAACDRGTLALGDAAEIVAARLPDRLKEIGRGLITGWYYKAMEPIPGMKELLRDLKDRGFNLYVLSNANADFDNCIKMVPGSEYMTGTFASAFYRLVKPEHEIYERFLAEFSLKAEECLFIDDNQSNVEAAIRCGFSGLVGYQNAERLRREIFELTGQKQ